jgi:hypothetical protein
MGQSAPFLRFVIAGSLTRDYLVLPDGQVAVDILGGNLLYTAAGMAIWDQNIGLLAKISENYPQEWLLKIQERNFDTRGVQIVTEDLEHRNFIAYPTIDQPVFDNPLAHFSRVGKPFPKSLLGFQPSNNHFINFLSQERSIKLKDVPFDYLDVTAAHICPMDFSSQTRIPSHLRQGHVMTISLLASDEYMETIYWERIGTVIKGINSFICTENQIRNLFLGRSSDLWEMAEALTAYGCEYVTIFTNNRRYFLYDHILKRKYNIPAYNSSRIDPTGSLDSFCGGFLAGLRTVHEPLQSAIQGSVSASFTQEGVGPFYCMDALPGLVNARYDSLKMNIIQV